ncbi:MAG: hypothetical protein RSB50_09410 [Cetobacterium sp.]
MSARTTDSGVDTIQLEMKGVVDTDKINDNSILKNKTRFTKDNNTKIGYIVGLENGKRRLSTIQETIEFIKEKRKRGEVVGLCRLDVAVDFMETLEEKRNLFRMLLECLAKEKKIVKDVFATVKGIAIKGNLKISNNRLEYTIYNHEDKTERKGCSRLEVHNNDLRVKDITKKVIEEKTLGFITDLKECVKYMEQIEENYINGLEQKYQETKGNFRTFSEFVAWADYEGYIMTSEILKGLIKRVGIKSTYNSFRDMFKRNRKETLKFTSRKELETTIKNIEKELKKCVKN